MINRLASDLSMVRFGCVRSAGRRKSSVRYSLEKLQRWWDGFQGFRRRGVRGWGFGFEAVAAAHVLRVLCLWFRFRQGPTAG